MDETVFPDQGYEGLKEGDATPAFAGIPGRDGYEFMGWTPAVSPVVSEADADTDGRIVYTATWARMLRITGIANKLVGSAEEAKAAGLDVADVDYPGGDGKVAVPYDGKVKLLYEITITGDPGKEFMVTDDGAIHVGGPELNADLTMPKGGSVVIYATRVFTVADIDVNGKLSNTATVTPGKGIESSSSSTETTPAWEAVLDSELPKTGGVGTGAYVVAGVFLIVLSGGAAVWYAARRRRDGGGDPHGRDA